MREIESKSPTAEEQHSRWDIRHTPDKALPYLRKLISGEAPEGTKKEYEEIMAEHERKGSNIVSQNISLEE